MATPISNSTQSPLSGVRTLRSDQATDSPKSAPAPQGQQTESSRPADDSVSLSTAARRLGSDNAVSLDAKSAAAMASRVAQQMSSNGAQAMLAQASRLPDNIATLLAA